MFLKLCVQKGLAHINIEQKGKALLDHPVMMESYLPSLSLSGSMSLMGEDERFIQ